MKKGVLLIFFFTTLIILTIQVVSAALTLQKEAVTDIIIKELSQPAEFSVTVKNTAGTADYVEFYTFVDVLLSPKGAIKIDKLEEKSMSLKVFPSKKLRNEKTGSYTFVYYLKSQQQEPIEDRLVVRFLPLKELFEVDMPDIITLDTTEIALTMENKENITFDNIAVRVKSAFIDSSKQISLNAFEKKNVTFEIDAAKLKNILAGKYITTISLTVRNEATLSIEKEIEVREKSNIATFEQELGNIFYPIVRITKQNQGNVVSDVDIIIKKNIFANAFTTFNQLPDEATKSAAFYTYKWFASLKPNESFSVEVKTNYLAPLGILFALAFITLLAMLWFMTPLIVTKKAVRIKSKSGEFTLKIMLRVRARKDISKVTLRDRIPYIAELHERYGTIKPTVIDKQRKMLEWHMPELKKGEEQIFSYIIYSKVAILGNYQIPRAFAAFEVKGKKKQTTSNRVIFMSEEHVPM